MAENPRKRKKRSSAPLITLFILIMVGLLYFGWSYISGYLPWQPEPEKEINQSAWQGNNPAENETWQLQNEEPTTLQMAKGDEETSPASQNECMQTADKILLFFEHLDQQNYIRGMAVKGSALDHFRGIINKLIANPPVVVRETDDLFAILNNMSHFYRILGPRDILLIKDILAHEREFIEPTLSLFYKWSEIAPECPDSELDIDLPLTGLYEYAGYFVNTLGGQSYLFRRDLYLRILIRYYSILVIDRANSMDANRYGIDIRYTLDSLISEIQGSDNLLYRQEYLENLLRLQEKYQAE